MVTQDGALRQDTELDLDLCGDSLLENKVPDGISEPLETVVEHLSTILEPVSSDCSLSLASPGQKSEVCADQKCMCCKRLESADSLAEERGFSSSNLDFRR